MKMSSEPLKNHRKLSNEPRPPLIDVTKEDMYLAEINSSYAARWQFVMALNDLNYHRKCLGLLRAEKRRLKVVEAERRRREEQAAKEWRAGYQDRKNLRNKLAAQALAEGRWGDAAAIAKDQAYEDYLMGNRSRADYEKGCENIDRNIPVLEAWKREADIGREVEERLRAMDPADLGKMKCWCEQAREMASKGNMEMMYAQALGYAGLPNPLDIEENPKWSTGMSFDFLFISIVMNSSSGVSISFGLSAGFGISAYIERDPNPNNRTGQIVGISGYYIGGGGTAPGFLDTILVIISRRL